MKRRAVKLARKNAARSTLLRPGERLLANYAHRAAECDCPPTHVYLGVDAIRAARIEGWGNGGCRDGVDRCLGCDKEWPSKQYDDDRRAA